MLYCFKFRLAYKIVIAKRINIYTSFDKRFFCNRVDVIITKRFMA